MASRTGITWDSVVKAGTDMMEVAGASLQRTMKIQEVTSSKDNDSQPAYALNELVQTCNKNSDDARAIAAALLRRASSTNPVVKWKALRAIRYICQNANTTQFKKACGGPAASVIREAISWSGPPHPQLGNALNLRVREAAKETLDEVFRISAASSAGAMSGAGSNLQGRIQGYGSTTGGKIQSAGPPGGGGSGTGGFSNTGTGGKKYGGISSDDYFAGSTRGQWSTWSDASQSALGPSGSASTASSPPQQGTPATTTGTSAARAAIGSEESVVAELCRGSGGVQPRPTPEALRAFVAKASQLDAEVVALELTHKLFNTPWQERVRALDGMHAIAEAVKSRGGGHPLQATTESLCSVTEAFAGVLGHENAAVRAAAGRVMRALGVESSVAAAVAAAPATGVAGGSGAAPTAPGGSLLGGFDEPAAVASPPRAAGAAAAAPGIPAMEDLLGGLDDGLDAAPASASPAQQGGLDMLAGLDGLEGAATAAPAAPAAPSAVTDMFAGLTVSGGGAAAVSPTPAATPPAADQLDALLGGLDDAPAPAPAAHTLNGRSGAAAAGAVSAPAMVSDPLAGLGDLDFTAVMPAQPPAAPSQAPPTAGGLPGPAVDGGLHGMHAMPNGTQAPAGMAQLGLQPGMAPPGMFGAAPAPAPAALFGGIQAAAGYGGPGVRGMQGMQGMQPGYGMQAAMGGWNGQAGGVSGQQMPGMPAAAAHVPGAVGGGAAVGGGMGLPQGSVGPPVAQHAFAHAAGTLGGHKDAFDFVNDVMKK